MTRTEFTDLQSRCSASGQTLKAFLRKKVISYSTYNYWRKKHDSESKVLPMAPIRITERRKRESRLRAMMERLPVLKTEIIEPERGDPARYRRIGEEITRTLECEPGRLYVKEPIRPKTDRPEGARGEGARRADGPMPLLPIYKGIPGASMLTEILLDSCYNLRSCSRCNHINCQKLKVKFCQCKITTDNQPMQCVLLRMLTHFFVNCLDWRAKSAIFAG